VVVVSVFTYKDLWLALWTCIHLGPWLNLVASYFSFKELSLKKDTFTIPT